MGLLDALLSSYKSTVKDIDNNFKFIQHKGDLCTFIA